MPTISLRINGVEAGQQRNYARKVWIPDGVIGSADRISTLIDQRYFGNNIRPVVTADTANAAVLVDCDSVRGINLLELLDAAHAAASNTQRVNAG